MKIIFILFAGILASLSLSSCAELKPCTIGGVEKPKLHKLSREGIDAEFGLRIKNPNKMKVIIYPSEFDGTVNGVNVGKVKLYKKVKIKGNSDAVEMFYVKADFSKFGLGDITKMLPIVSSGSADLALKGEIRAGKWYYKKKFPVEFSRNIGLK